MSCHCFAQDCLAKAGDQIPWLSCLLLPPTPFAVLPTITSATASYSTTTTTAPNNVHTYIPTDTDTHIHTHTYRQKDVGLVGLVCLFVWVGMFVELYLFV